VARRFRPNYIITMTIGARKFVDQSRDSHSLWRMLFEIVEHLGLSVEDLILLSTETLRMVSGIRRFADS